MKNILILMVIAFLFSCEAKKEQVIATSPDEKVQIIFTGKKTTALDPWQVSINVKGYEFDETVMTELYNSAIDSTTIMVDWQNNNHAIILLQQQDNQHKVMQLNIKEGYINLQ